MATRALLAATHDDTALLDVARDWKAGRLRRVHPTVGHLLNQTLVRHGETAAPFRLHTTANAPLLSELIRAEHECASTRADGLREAA